MGIWRAHITAWDRQIDGMQAFYVNALLRSLVFALVGIFTPVFIYTSMLPVLGAPAYAIGSVAVFYLIVRIVVFVINIPVARIIEKIGFRRSVLTSAVILLLYFAAMIGAEGNYRLLPVAAVLMGVSIPFYWVARGCVVAIETRSEEMGRRTSYMAVLERIAGVLGPVTAGFMIEKWGFPVLYTVAAAILAVSVLPLFAMPHHVHRNGVSWKGYLGWIKARRFFHQAVGSVGLAFDDYAAAIVWPLVILLMGIQYGTLGSVFSFIAFISIAVRFAAGPIFDKLYKKKDLEDEILFGFAAVGTAVAWVVRIFVTAVSGVLWVDGGAMIFGTTYRSIQAGYDMLGGKRMHEIAYFTYKEMTYSLAAVGFCLLWIAGAYYGVWKEMLFLSAAIWTLASIVQGRESNLK